MSRKKFVAKMRSLFERINQRQYNFNIRIEKELQDVKALLVRLDQTTQKKKLKFVAEAPLADWSWDHKQPAGATNDDTRCGPFVWRSEQYFQKKMKICDLGCAGGGLVYDFISRGHFAVGIDGSDVNLVSGRAHWGIIPENLYVADITKDFYFFDQDSSSHFKFDLITAWEVMEHIPENLVEPLMANVARHLDSQGCFACSIATFPHFDPVSGAIWHVNIHPKKWWIDKFDSLGFEAINDHPFLTRDFPRGSGNPFAADWNAETHPQLGFHLILKKKY